MDTPVANTGASAAPVAAPAASAPVASPAAPTAPVTPATPAAPPTPAPGGNVSPREAMKQKMVAALEAANKGEDAPVAQGTVDEQQQPVVDDPADLTQDTPNDDKQQQQQEGNPEALEGEDFSLEVPGPLPPAELQAKLKEIPELAEILNQHEDLKNSLFAAARLAQRTAQYDQQFPGGLEEAKIAAEGNKTFTNLSNLFVAVKDRQSTQTVLGEMMKLSYVLDDDGNPVINQKTGKPQTDGSVGKFIEQTFGLGLDHWAQVAQEKGDDELAVAIDVLKARAFNTRPASAQEDLTDEQRATQEALAQREKMLTEREQAAETEKSNAFYSKVDDAYYGHMDSALDRVMKQVAGTDDEKAAIRKAIKDRVDEVIGGNPNFLYEKSAIEQRSGYGDKKLNAMKALGSRWINSVLPEIARQELLKNGEKLLGSQKTKNERLNQRESANEPQAAMRHTAPTTMSTEQLHAKFREDFIAKNKRQPTAQEVLSGVRLLRQGGVRTT